MSAFSNLMTNIFCFNVTILGWLTYLNIGNMFIGKFVMHKTAFMVANIITEQLANANASNAGFSKDRMNR